MVPATLNTDAVTAPARCKSGRKGHLSAAGRGAGRVRAELIRERTLAGLTAARARGRDGGWKFALAKTQVRLVQVAMAHRDTSVSALCRELGINPVTLYRYVGPQGDLEARTSSPLHVSVG